MTYALGHSTAESHGFADATVIERVLEGETQAFAELVRRYQAPLYRHAVGIVLDHDVAADMVQDAFIRAYTNLNHCRDRARFRAWIFQTLRHRCLDHLKEARHRGVPLDDAPPLADPAADPADATEHERMRGAVAQALATLSPAQREAFVMHYVDGVRYDTMAELLDTSVSALKMRVLRARDALRDALSERGVTESPAARLTVVGGWRTTMHEVEEDV